MTMPAQTPSADAAPAPVATAVALGRALEAAGWMVVTAESCTGGLLGWALTEIGGSSVWYERGFITYSNEAKQQMLGVTAATLAAQGAVSEATAREMAQGALRASRAQLALSVTGVAGPTGGSPDKPVGTVCFGWATADRVETTLGRVDRDRAQVRAQAAVFALSRALALVPGRGGLTLST